MGKLFVIFVATVATLWALALWIPGIYGTAFNTHGISVSWMVVCFFPIGYVYHRLTSKG